MDLSALLTLDALFALLALTTLEVVLGIDNLVLITVLSGKLPEAQRKIARRIGLALALIARLLLLGAIGWLIRLTEPIFTVFEHGYSVRDLLLILGGLFLVAKATYEIHETIEEHRIETAAKRAGASFAIVVGQIVAMDVVFSFDSVITAVGMTDLVPVMVAAVVIAIGAMLIFVGPVARFVERHPTVKMLALAFMLLIGVMLVADGLGQHVPRGYIYSAMAFSAFVEGLNLQIRKRTRKTDEATKAAGG